MNRRRFAVLNLALLLAGAPRATWPQDWRVTVLSSRHEMATGGDALVQLTGSDITTAKMHATLNARDITKTFRPALVPDSLASRVDGLRLGSNTLEITAGGKVRVRAELINHPITGPVF